MEDKINKIELISEFLYKPLIEKKVKIIDSKVETQIGLEGGILYESFYFFYILKKDSDKVLKISKKENVFEFYYKGKALNIDGSFFKGTVLSRIKKIK
jgi:RNase P/RNase MRP subunit p29